MFLKRVAKGAFYVVGTVTIILLLLKIDDEFQDSIFSIEDANSIGVDIVTVSDSELDYTILESLASDTENVVLASQEKNADVKAWLRILDTKIDYPVMYTGDDFYLTHNESGKKSDKGAIYIDRNTPLDSGIVVINGHNMKSGDMFAKLLAYKSESYAKKHCYIEWTTESGTCNYKVFAVCIVPSDYLGNILNSQDNSLANVGRMLQYDSEYYFDFDTTDQILILNTCTYEFTSAHLLVCAYKIE